MNKLGMKLNLTGWIVFAISFMVANPVHEYINGIATGLFISSAWVTIVEYRNQ
jgi:hypothetical protein